MTLSHTLIADYGATNIRFALVDTDGNLIEKQNFLCDDFSNIYDSIKSYLNKKVDVKKAILAIAGPIGGEYCEFSNRMPWSFFKSDLKEKLNLDQLIVLNDLEAVAIGIPDLDVGDYRKIGGGEACQKSTIGVIGPGTGLGTAFLTWHDEKYIAHSAEGGNIVAPIKTEREFKILQEIQKIHPVVPAEFLCSGMGISNIYKAIKSIDKIDIPNRSPAEITSEVLSGKCAVCRETLDLMTRFLGRIAGDMALMLNAKGGIYIAGGIPRKFGAYFYESPFRSEFENKGPMREYVSKIPAFLITRSQSSFVGLKSVALRHN